MLALTLCVSLAGGACSPPVQAHTDGFVVLHRAERPRERSSGLLGVLARSGHYGVLARGGVAGTYALADDLTAVATPFPELPTALRPAEWWVTSPMGSHVGVASVTGSGANAVTSVAIVGGATVSSAGVLSAAIVEDGSRVLFFDTGASPEEPMRVQLVDPAQGRALDFEVESVGAIRFSASGETVAVAAGGQLAVHRAGRNPLALPGCEAFHVDASGARIVCASEGELSVFTLDGTGVAGTKSLGVDGPLIAASDLGDLLLFVTPSRADLHDLAAQGREPVSRKNAPRGARFVSCDLRASDQGILIALGARRKVVPQMAVPGQSATPHAEATVLVLAEDGQPVLEQRFAMSAWEADHPRVRWADDGRLLVVTRDRALTSRDPLP